MFVCSGLGFPESVPHTCLDLKDSSLFFCLDVKELIVLLVWGLWLSERVGFGVGLLDTKERFHARTAPSRCGFVVLR